MSIFTTAACRIRQVFIRLRRKTKTAAGQTVEEGTGAFFSTAQLLRANRLKKPLVIVGNGAGAWSERLLHALEDSDVEYAVWDKLSVPPSIDDAENIRLYWIGEKCDCFVAIGEPDALDIAKAASARAGCRGKTVMSMVGANRIRRKRLPPVVVIPTIPGSGAESLAVASVANEKGTRFLLSDRALMPAYAVLDPALAENADRPLLAEAIMQGVCLAAEAYISGYADDTARMHASDSLRAFFASAESCWNDGGTEQQRELLFTASRQAGMAATRAGGGYAGALARAAEKVAGVSFGAACAVILPMVLERYGNDAAERLAELSLLADILPDGTRAERAAALISRIRSLAFRVGLPDTMEGVPVSAAEEIADIAAAEANPEFACPLVWTAQQCGEIIRDAINL